MHLNSIARPLGHTMLEVQETQKVVPPEYHDFLPLFLEEGAWQYHYNDLAFTMKSISNLTSSLYLDLSIDSYIQNSRIKRNG
jgi:hypothetical protein